MTRAELRKAKAEERKKKYFEKLRAQLGRAQEREAKVLIPYPTPKPPVMIPKHRWKWDGYFQ